MTDFAPPLSKLGASGIGVATAPTGGMGLALDSKGFVPQSAISLPRYAGAATADLTLTAAFQNITGATITATDTGVYLVIGVFDFFHSVAGAGTATGGLAVASSAATGGADLNEAAVRATVSQVWVISVTAANTVLQLHALKGAVGGTVKALAGDTTITAVKIAPV